MTYNLSMCRDGVSGEPAIGDKQRRTIAVDKNNAPNIVLRMIIN
jgi:hypothetical protein